MTYDTDNLALFMLYHKKTRTAMKWVWIVLSVIIIISMIFVFSGGTGIV